MEISIDQARKTYDQPVMVAQCLADLTPEADDQTLAVMRGGEVLERTALLEKSCALSPISFAQEEGLRIYERSLRFVLLLAMDRLFPGKRVRVEYSVGSGILVKLTDEVLTRNQVAQIGEEMRRLTQADLPFAKKVWQREDAARYFAARGETDKVRLLNHRPYPFFTMYCCGGMWEYFYGAMLPSTAWVNVFALRQHYPGLVLQLPARSDPGLPAPYVSRPKHLAVFAQSAEWCEILGATNAADIAEMMEAGRLRQFIRVNEALHDRSIAAIADRIKASHARAILISGPSSSGKTTFAHRLEIHLRVLGYRPMLLSLDDFYLNRDTLSPGPDGQVDLEDIHTLDIPLIGDCMESLLAGRETAMPSFDFVTGKRREKMELRRLEPEQPILIEGIHGLNPLISGELPADVVHKIYVSALTCINLDDHNRIRTTDVRLLRRIVRDYRFRGTKPADTMAMWDSVRRGEERWIFPYQEQADSMFNTALHYELPVLKTVAYEQLKAIGPQDPCYLMSRRLLKTLHYFPEPDDALLSEIPPLSILREFIGGCTFYE